MQSALEYETIAICPTTKARVSKLKLPHYTVDLPMFMPVGTQGTIKGLTSKQLEELNVQILLGNTYHLSQRPGAELLDEMGGLHKFMNWKRAILTDSGGFQMVSLLDLANITEKGVEFQSPHDGSTMLLTPEHSMHIQNKIGADIMMALDDVVSSLTKGPRVEEAMYRTIRWIDRCIKAHERPQDQNLFAIIQGGLDPKLRDICLNALIDRFVGYVARNTIRHTPGYAIGGLSGGESKDDFWRIVTQCTGKLPSNKPRYCMGVGYPVDLVVCVALGVDMFDCVYPCRTARFGTALVNEESGTLKLKSSACKLDFRPMDPHVYGFVNQYYSRAYLHKIASKEQVGCHLLTHHNIAYQLTLMNDMREAITKNYFPEWVISFMEVTFPSYNYPKWVEEALASVNITLKK